MVCAHMYICRQDYSLLSLEVVVDDEVCSVSSSSIVVRRAGESPSAAFHACGIEASFQLCR